MSTIGYTMGIEVVSELREETFRRLVAATVLTSLVALLGMSLLVNEDAFMVEWALWFALAASGLAVRALSRKQVWAAELVWATTIACIVSALVVRHGRSEFCYALALLPLIASLTSGWKGTVVYELLAVAACVMLSGLLSRNLISNADIVACAVSSLLAGVIGWTAHDVLYTITEWSQRGFEQVRKTMEEARRNRGQLAQVLVDLDRAYYRLERTNAALVASWRASAQAERFRTRYANTLSHELRTPLNLIIGFSEMMATAPEKYENTPLPAAYRSDLNVVYRNAQHLLHLVNDVLDLASSDAGQLPLHRELADMGKVVSGAVAMVQEYIEAKGLDLQVSLDDNLSQVSIDPLRIRQVILNLLVNAVRFTEHGTIGVQVRQEQHHIKVFISDTGRGIEAQSLSHVFREFATDGRRSDEGWTGSGLGLPISKRLVELHGGEMTVESVFKQGSVFSFTLPLDVEAETAGNSASQLKALVPQSMPADRRLVIAVDHSSGAVAALARALGDCQVKLAKDQEEAVEMANEGHALALLSPHKQRSPNLEPETLHISCELIAHHKDDRFLQVAQVLEKPVSQEALWMALESLDQPIGSVLIADDDVDTVRMLRRMLYPQIEPDRCCEAHNGREALRVVEQLCPDLIILDLVMPEMDGYAVLGELAIRGEPLPKVIILTGQASAQPQWVVEGPIRIETGTLQGLPEFSRVLRAVLAESTQGWN